MWELTRKCGDRSLRVALQFFAIGNRNGGLLPTMSQAFARVVAGMCQVSASTVTKVWQHSLTYSWIVCDPVPRLRNYPYSQKSWDRKKSQPGRHKIRLDKIRLEENKYSHAPAQPAGFAEFWSSYPRKKNKGEAERIWKKINPSEDLRSGILNSIEALKKSPDWNRGVRFIPYPATWLNAKGWFDETENGRQETADEYLKRKKEEAKNASSGVHR